MELEERRRRQDGAATEASTHARGNRADDRNFARDGHPAVCGDEEAPDRAVERLDSGDSQHGGAARNRQPQLAALSVPGAGMSAGRMIRLRCEKPWETP